MSPDPSTVAGISVMPSGKDSQLSVTLLWCARGGVDRGHAKIGLGQQLAHRVGTGKYTLFADGQEIDTIDQRLCHLAVDKDPGAGHNQLDDPLLETGLFLDSQVFRLRQTDENGYVLQPHEDLMSDFEGLDGDEALERKIGILGCHTLRGLPRRIVRSTGQAGKPTGFRRGLGCRCWLDQNQAERRGDGAGTESVAENPGG